MDNNKGVNLSRHKEEGVTGSVTNFFVVVVGVGANSE
jgi:hypothetical protein